MATAKTKKKTEEKRDASFFTSEYIKYVLRNGEEPKSVFGFTDDLGIPEAEFYDYFTSFDSLRQHYWLSIMNETIEVIEKDKAYAEYSVREKMLAFYYTLIDRLKEDRSYVSHVFSFQGMKPEITPRYLKHFRDTFISFTEKLLSEGMENKEVKSRGVISDRYKDALWLQLIFVIRFWVKDTSLKFESTDAVIEKSVNLAFELMGNGPLDQMVDFAKFMFQQARA